MPTPFIMPKFDMDQEEATIVEWLKSEGDQVELDESVLTVETDKVAIEVPSPASGKLTKISFNPGDVVPVTTVIAYILAEGETEDDLPKEAAIYRTESATVDQDELAVSEAKLENAVSATPLASRMAQSLGVDLKEVPATKDRVTKEDVEVYVRSKGPADGRVKTPATPAARRLAQEFDVDLALVSGSGPNGRVQEDDVKAFRPSPASQEVLAMEMINC